MVAKGKYNTAYIYIAGTDGGPLKIGHSHDTATRAYHLERESGGRITIFGKWPVGSYFALSTERYIHWRLKKHHVRGEWFDVSLKRAIAVVKASIAKGIDHDELVPPLVKPGATGLTKAHYVQIQDVLSKDESRFDFIRTAVEREIKRRKG